MRRPRIALAHPSRLGMPSLARADNKGVRRQLTLALCLGLIATCDATGLVAYVSHNGPLHLDFFGIWSWARFEIERPPALLYDHAVHYAFLRSLDPLFRGPFPFSYPPPYLLLIRPLGWLSYPVAQAIWSGTTLLAYTAAVCGPTWRPQTVALLLLAPASAVNLLYGQNGFLTAALLVGGMRLAPSRPVLGGSLLGLLAYKPQFGLLIMVALAVAGLWRAALAAALTIAALVAASLIAFGHEPWVAWVRAMPVFVALLDADRAHLLRLMPTVLSGALTLGASARLAGVVQAAATAAAAAGVWIAFRRWAGRTAVAVLAVAAVLASPYAFLYDLTLVAAAVALVAAECWTALSGAEILVLIAALLLPAGMLLGVVPSVAAVVHGAMLVMIVVRHITPVRALEPAAIATIQCPAAAPLGVRGRKIASGAAQNASIAMRKNTSM